LYLLYVLPLALIVFILVRTLGARKLTEQGDLRFKLLPAS